MRQWITLVALGALLAMPCPAPAGDAGAQPTEEQRTDDELLDEHMDALRDYEQAETDEEAEEAQKRFEDASEQELKIRRDRLEHALER